MKMAKTALSGFVKKIQPVVQFFYRRFHCKILTGHHWCIMARRFDFWTHGVTTVLESPELARRVEHKGNIGTAVEQEANTSAWFHLPLTTPTVIEDDVAIYLRRFGLKATVNDNAKIDLLHLRSGTRLVWSRDVSYVGRVIDETFDVEPDITTGGATAGLVLCVHVQFLSGAPRGRVEFHGAGGHFS